MADPVEKKSIPRLATSIRGKLIVAMILVAVVPLVFMVFASNRLTSNQLSSQAGGSVQQVASTIADLASQALVENVHLVQTLAGVGGLTAQVEDAAASYQQIDGETGQAIPIDIEAELKARDDEWQNTFTYSPEVIEKISDEESVNPVGFELHRFRNRFPRYVELLATDVHGALLAATNRTQSFYFASQPWWQSAIAGNVYIGAPVEDADTGVISVTLGLPIRGASGEVVGTLSSALDVREINGILSQVNLGETGVVRIYDAAGVALFDPTSSGLGSGRLPQGLTTAGVLQTATGGWRRTTSVAGQDAVHGYAKPRRTGDIEAIDNLGWTTVASQDASEALSAVRLFTLAQVLTAVVVAIFAIVGSVILSRLLTVQIHHISRLFDEIHQGNYEARAAVESRDELGRMTTELNTMLDNTLTLIQSREERDAIQGSVVRLLEEVADVAQGDLTVRAEVTPDITGAIADSFNFMVTELRRVIGDVQETSGKVSTAATTIRERMDDLAGGSSSQSQQILEAEGRIRQMASSVQQVSSNAAICSSVASQSLTTAQLGTTAVTRTVTGMSSIRNQVREASKRLKRLGESSQEIGKIVRLISEVSDRTSILALNASIQAAAAGEAGDSFAVVADEIELLAERSAEASQRIETLIKTVQVETAEAMAAMEDTTREVVHGSELAHDAGRALEEIESVSTQLADLVETISTAASEQARSSEVVAASMGTISQITQQTAFGTREAANEADILAGQADGLRDSVRRFTVPAKVA